jgi:hypothetical protein
MVAEIASLGAKTEVQAGTKQAKNTLESIPGRNLMLAIATPRQSHCQNCLSIKKKKEIWNPDTANKPTTENSRSRVF